MKKTLDVKATKLMVDDSIEIGGRKYRIRYLNLAFGRGTKNTVRIHAYLPENDTVTIQLQVPESTRFTIYNQK